MQPTIQNIAILEKFLHENNFKKLQTAPIDCYHKNGIQIAVYFSFRCTHIAASNGEKQRIWDADEFKLNELTAFIEHYQNQP